MPPRQACWWGALAGIFLGPGAASGMAAAEPAAPPAAAHSLTTNQLGRLGRALEPLHARYDPAERLLREPFRSPGYHTALSGGMVHPTRSSLQYALALLDTGDDALRERALDIIRRVVALQDPNPESRTYGIWSWFLEEPLGKMSPPDWNWADFLGVTLLQIARDHRDRLPPEVRDLVDAALQHAARSIQRRNVGPDYTNIALMGTYVTLATAELYDLEDLRAYATARLRRLHEHVTQQGAFTPDFALGTINRGDLWNQRRPLIAYWGTPEKPAYLRLRCLRDGYDFAAAQFFSAQQGGAVLAAINFATDGGNTHVSLDRLTNGVFRAKDLRLRFEFGGAGKDLKLPTPSRAAIGTAVRSGNLRFDLHVLYAAFAGAAKRWEVSRTNDTVGLDYVLHQGAERTFNLAAMEAAALGLIVCVHSSTNPPPTIRAGENAGRLWMTWDEMALNVPVRPAKVAELQKAVRFAVDRKDDRKGKPSPRQPGGTPAKTEPLTFP